MKVGQGNSTRSSLQEEDAGRTLVVHVIGKPVLAAIVSKIITKKQEGFTKVTKQKRYLALRAGLVAGLGDARRGLVGCGGRQASKNNTDYTE
jgi:hypothetical protein